MLKKLWNHLSKRRHKQFWLLLILMILASLSEIVSIGSVFPFLGVLTAPEQVYQHQLMQPLVQILELTEPNQLILPLTVVFILAVLMSGIVRLILLYVMIRLSFAMGADLSINIYRRTLYQDYSIHVARNSSEVINGIITKTTMVINEIIKPVLILLSSTILLVGIMSTLLAINITVALVASTGFGLLYWIVIHYTYQSVEENSKVVAEESTKMIKSLQEGLGGIRDVIIDGSQQFYCQQYRNADLPLRRAAGNNHFVYESPRYVMEAIGMTLIAGLAYLMSKQAGGIATIIPVLGAFALGAQKLIPSTQQAYGAYTNIKGSKASLEDVLSLLDQPLPSYVDQPRPIQIPFEKAIHLNKLSFRYTKETPWILKNIDLKITKGSRIGLMGVTGSGKSTLFDIIMGLLSPTDGELIIDDKPINKENGRSWQAHISHVPQNIYLTDNTIEENIAFGIPREQINHQQVKNAAKQAQIAELIEEWSDGYQTLVGERGIRLSGGQRQRIGIARALFKGANVLIFDEATSALDDKTEQAVMEAIEGLGRELTILIIAHRLTTLKGCDQVIELSNNGKLSISWRK